MKLSLIAMIIALLGPGCTEANPAHVTGDAEPVPLDAATDGLSMRETSADGPVQTIDGRPAPDLEPILDMELPADGHLPPPPTDSAPPPLDVAITPDGPDPDISVTCGNGVREGQEECDDGNLLNLDGCDQACRFEQCHRINELQMQYGTASICSKNALGGAIVNGVIQTQLDSAIDAQINSGNSNILIKFLQLDDLTGADDPALMLGVMNGPPWITGAGIDHSNNLDGWYVFNWSDVDDQRVPLNKIPAKIASHVLSAGPGAVGLTWGFPISGTMVLSNVTLNASLSAVSKPLVATSLDGPGHLTSENLDPSLTSFAAAGSTGSGTLCGRVSAASLDMIALDSSLLSYCSESYPSSSGASMLDVLIAGCSLIILDGVVPTQPDTDDPDVPPVGAGPPYTLSSSSGSTNVSICRDKNNVQVPLQPCLKDAAYSAFFKFASGRVIIKCSGPNC